MPPKKAKKPKKTKEELEAERIAREQEEARLKEEERLRLEQERKQREEAERKRLEEEARQRAAELERLKEEFTSAQEELQARQSSLDTQLRQDQIKKEWEKYLACEPRPDAMNEGEINSYINTWDTEIANDLEKVISSCDYANAVLSDLQNVAAEAESTGKLRNAQLCGEFLDSLKRIIQEKIDRSTAFLIQHSDDLNEGGAKSEIKVAYQAENIKVGVWINAIAKGFRNRRIEFPEIGINIDIPKPVALQQLAIRVTQFPYDEMATKRGDLPDLPLGGVFVIDLLAIPRAPKKVKGWTIRQFANTADHEVEKLPYPLEGVVTSTVLPIKAQLCLPPDVVFDREPRLGWWDAAERQWNEDGITEINFNAETRVLNFHTIKLTTMAVLQERNRHFPRTAWKLNVEQYGSTNEVTKEDEPRGHLIIQCPAQYNFDIEIRPGACRLKSPEIQELKELNTNFHPPGELIKKLALAGLNIAPTAQDNEIFGYITKVPEFEDRLITELCRISTAFQVSSYDPQHLNKEWHNLAKRPTCAVFVVKEIQLPSFVTNPEDDDNPAQPADDDYHHVLAHVDNEAPGGGVKFRLDTSLERNLDGSVKSENIYDTHVYLSNALKKITTSDAADRLQTSSVIFEQTLKKLLHLIRPFSYCPLEMGKAPVLTEEIMAQNASTVEAGAELPAAVESARSLKSETSKVPEIAVNPEAVEIVPPETTVDNPAE